MKVNGARGKLVIIGVPGDRDDSVIEQAGRVAGRGFHRVIIKEDIDLRGRGKGEVAKLRAETDRVRGYNNVSLSTHRKPSPRLIKSH
jgi:UDP-N-acetylmuramyl tripeptide synthase